jgi:hypothetical protein
MEDMKQHSLIYFKFYELNGYNPVKIDFDFRDKGEVCEISNEVEDQAQKSGELSNYLLI